MSLSEGLTSNVKDNSRALLNTVLKIADLEKLDMAKIKNFERISLYICSYLLV